MSRKLYSVAEREHYRAEGFTTTLDVDGLVANVTMTIHVPNRCVVRGLFPPAYKILEAQKTVKQVFSNIDLFDTVVTTKEHSFAVYDEKTDAVYLGSLWLDQTVPDLFFSTYWYGKPFHADPDDLQIVVLRDGTVKLAIVYDYMIQRYAKEAR